VTDFTFGVSEALAVALAVAIVIDVAAWRTWWRKNAR
jgi:hypothetical protein